MTDGRAAGVYALALAPTAVAALAVGGLVMDLADRSAPGRPSGVGGWVLNIVPALAIGLLSYFALAHFVRPAPGAQHTPAAHARRCAALYLVALGLGVGLVHDAGSPDFWSLGQLVFWPWLVAVGGILADGLIVWRRSRCR